VLFFSLFLTGSLPGVERANPFSNLIRILGRAGRVLFSSNIVPILRSLFWDVLLQRRLFQRSRTRWAIHALIFWAFVFRFFWGLVALLGSLWRPDWPIVWDMVNKNHPATGLFFDGTGLILLLGVIFAFIRGTLNRRHRAPGLPEQDLVALGLIGGIVVAGFISEGMRIALTGYPDGSGYAFLGYGIGRLFSMPRGLTEAYGFMWYIHALLTGAFMAYLPFSRLLHVIIAPIVLPMQAVSPHHPEPTKATAHQKGEVNGH
jgi:nitrate reductase gamma subunit